MSEERKWELVGEGVNNVVEEISACVKVTLVALGLTSCVCAIAIGSSVKKFLEEEGREAIDK